MSLFANAVNAANEWVVVNAADGARSELAIVRSHENPADVIYWLPALGVPAKHYLPLAEAFATRRMAVALHEWRGIGSSDCRASRQVDWGYRELLENDIPAGIAQIQARWPEARLWIGGHSLGGQLACLYACLHRRDAAGILLIASGAPFWRCFPKASLLRCAYSLASPLARLLGHFPGRRLGFGGNEARGLIDDWSYSGMTGRYRAHGLRVDLERELAELALPVLALRLQDDWMVPQASLDWLLGKMPLALRRMATVSSRSLDGQPANHFAWMKSPALLADQLATWIADAGGSAADAAG